MSDLNQFACTGRLGADPEIRRFDNGDPVASFRVAVSEQWKSKDGEKKERTLWLPVSVMNKGLCSITERFLKKGSRVAISGKLQSRSYQKDGQDVWVTELVLGAFNGHLTLLEPRTDNSCDPVTQQQMHQVHGMGGSDSEIPF